MSKRTGFLLRTDDATLEALKRWAADELRSVNGQLEFIVRRALIDAGRMQPPGQPGRDDPDPDEN